MKRIAWLTVVVACAGLLAACGRTPSLADKAAALVDSAQYTVETFKQRKDPPMGLFRDMMRTAQGVVIIPNSIKGGFILAGEYGNGVMLVRKPDGTWSEPAFYTLGAGSVGLQAGGQLSEVILVIRSQAAAHAIVDHQGKLGADIGITVGTVGGGLESATTTNMGADVVSFEYAAGLYAGGSVEGSVLARRNDYNAAYYGAGATPNAILFSNTFSNPGADALRSSLNFR